MLVDNVSYLIHSNLLLCCFKPDRNLRTYNVYFIPKARIRDFSFCHWWLQNYCQKICKSMVKNSLFKHNFHRFYLVESSSFQAFWTQKVMRIIVTEMADFNFFNFYRFLCSVFYHRRFCTKRALHGWKWHLILHSLDS